MLQPEAMAPTTAQLCQSWLRDADILRLCTALEQGPLTPRPSQYWMTVCSLGCHNVTSGTRMKHRVAENQIVNYWIACYGCAKPCKS